MNSFQDTRDDQLNSEQRQSPEDENFTVTHVVTSCSARNCSCRNGCTSSNTVNSIENNFCKVHRESSLLVNNLPITGCNGEFKKQQEEEFIKDNCRVYSSSLSPIEEVIALENQSTLGGSNVSINVLTNFKQSFINKKTCHVEKKDKSEINTCQAALSLSSPSSSSNLTQQCNCLTRELCACEVKDTQNKEQVTKDTVKNNNEIYCEFTQAIKSDTNHHKKCNGDVNNTGSVIFPSPVSDFINKETEGEKDISSYKVDTVTETTVAAAATSSVTRTSTSTGESVTCQVKKPPSTSKRFSKVIQSLLPSLGRSKKVKVKVNESSSSSSSNVNEITSQRDQVKRESINSSRLPQDTSCSVSHIDVTDEISSIMSSSTSYSFQGANKSKKNKSHKECVNLSDKNNSSTSSSCTGDLMKTNNINGTSKYNAKNNLQVNKNNNHEKHLPGDRNNNPPACEVASSSPSCSASSSLCNNSKSPSSSSNNKTNITVDHARNSLHPLGTPVEMDASMKEKIANYETLFRRRFGSRKSFTSTSSTASSVDAFHTEVIGTFRYSNSHSPARVTINACQRESSPLNPSAECKNTNDDDAPKLKKSFSRLKSDHQKFISQNQFSIEHINQGLLEKLMQKQKDQQQQQQQQSMSPQMSSERPLSVISLSPSDCINNISPKSPTSSSTCSHLAHASPGTSSHVLKHIRSASNPLMKPTIAPKPRNKGVTCSPPSLSPTKQKSIITTNNNNTTMQSSSTTDKVSNTSKIIQESLNEIKCKNNDGNRLKFNSPFSRQFSQLSLRKYSKQHPILQSFKSKSNCNCKSSSPSRCNCEPLKTLISTSSIASYADLNNRKDSNDESINSRNNARSLISRRLSSPNSTADDLVNELKNKIQSNESNVEQQQQQQVNGTGVVSSDPPRLVRSPCSLAPSSVRASIIKKKAMRKRSKSLDPATAAATLTVSSSPSTGITSLPSDSDVKRIDDSSVNLKSHRKSHSPPSDSDCDSDYSDENSIKDNGNNRHERLSRLDSLRRCEKSEIVAHENLKEHHHHHHERDDHHQVDSSETGKKVNYKSANDRRLSCFSSSSSSTCSSFKSTPPASPYLSSADGSNKSRHMKHHRTSTDTGDFIGKLSATSSTSTLTSSNAAIDKINDDESHDIKGDNENTCQTIELTAEEKKLRKLYFIASELTTTEAQFVDKMNLLARELKSIAEKHLPKEQTAELFKYLDVLRNVSDYLLSQLQESLTVYKDNHKIAHVLVQIGPFLNCYSCFMVEFDKIKSMFDDCLRRYPSFASDVRDFELSDRCQKLSVKHYLLKPVQRIPQYRLLLEDYLKNLPEGHVDYDDAVKALAIVSTVAEHANQVIKEGDSFTKLLAIQNSLFPNKEIIKPGRVFLKQGDLMKVSRKELQQRRVVLCSDCLFYLTLLQSGLYRLNHEIPLDCMRVSTQKEEHSAYNNELTIISPFRSLILQAKSTSERDAWYTAITCAIDEYNTRKRTFQKNRPECYITATTGENLIDLPHNNGHSSVNNNYNQSNECNDTCNSNYNNNGNNLNRNSGSSSPILGDECPIWVPDDRVTMCQQCYSEFSAFFRRHHCRACGKVVCRQCSANRVPLRYRKFRVSRVCDTCFDRLKEMMEEKKNTRQGLNDIALSVACPSPILSIKFTNNTSKVKSATLKSTCSNTSNSSSSNFATASDSELDYEKLISQFTRLSVPRLSKRKAKEVPASLKVNGNDSSSNLRGYLFMKKKNKSKCKRYWFVVKDKVLYRFNASEDVIALNSEVLLGWKLQLSTEPLDIHPADAVFHLIHEGRPTMTFAAESPEQRQLWVDVITEALVL